MIAAGPFRLPVVLICLLYRLLCGLIRVLAHRGGERELELVVLRHQLAILRRSGKRPQYTTADRALLAAATARALLLPCGESADASPLAPGTAAGQSATLRSQARSSAACGRDAWPDPEAGAGEPTVGLHAHPG